MSATSFVTAAGGLVDTERSLLDGLARLRRAALDAFVDLPDDRGRKVSDAIEDYIREMRLNLELVRKEDWVDGTQLGAEQEQARATCEATGDNILTLLRKFEDYLESVLAARLAAGRERSER